MTATLIVLIVSLAVCLYIYVGYPLLVLVLGRVRPRPVRRASIHPAVTVLVPAFNEAAVIGDKVRNTLALKYPPDRLDVLVVSDGSTDDTERIVSQFDDPRVRLIALERGGKATALNAGVRRATGDIVVFTDANSLLAEDSLQQLVNNFADPTVGGVCGNKKVSATGMGDTTAQGENLYWRYDKWLKHQESRAGSIFAADGTLYAIRRELYVPIADPAQADDIAISTRIVLQGRRLLYEPAAVATEPAPAEGADEFRRKVRVTNHSMRALWNLGRSLWMSGFYSVELLSHKFFRHLVPFFLLAALASSVVLAPSHAVFATLLIVQLVCYALAVAGYVLRRTRIGRLRVFTVPYYFTMVNAAAFLGVCSILAGRRLHAWTPRGGLGVAILLSLCGSAAAQRPPEPFGGEVRASFLHYGNFFQAPENEPRTDVNAWQLEGRFDARLGSTRRTTVYGRADVIDYEIFKPSRGLVGGVRHDGDHSVDLSLELEWARPRFDVGDEFDQSDGLIGTMLYAYRLSPDVQLKALGSVSRETYDSDPTKNSTVLAAGGSFRYRGFGSKFSPEVGFTLGGRDSVDEDEGYQQRDLFVQVRSAPHPRVYLSGRYRHRVRDYSTEDPVAPNFGRDDTRHQITALAEVRVASPLFVVAYYAFQTADSTRPRRGFQTNFLSLGCAARF